MGQLPACQMTVEFVQTVHDLAQLKPFYSSRCSDFSRSQETFDSVERDLPTRARQIGIHTVFSPRQFQVKTSSAHRQEFLPKPPTLV